MLDNRLLRFTVTLALLLTAAPALAYGGFTVGVSGGVPTRDAYVLNVRAVQPMTTVSMDGTPLQFSARADVATSLSFDSLPSVGLTAVTSSTLEGIERYLGVGSGVSLPSWEGSGLLWSVYGLAGFRAPIVAGLSGALEFQLSRNALFTSPQVSLALEYTFGGEP